MSNECYAVFMINTADTTWDVVIIGGGFYGATLALFFAQQGKRVVILEKSDQLFTGASYVNQARVHNGYHYPRSIITALRSRINFNRFITDYPEVIDSDFEKIYAIAKNHSKVTARQFALFCQNIGAEFRPADADIASLFNKDTTESVFTVKEYAFNSMILRDLCLTALEKAGVDILYNTTAAKVSQGVEAGTVLVETEQGGGYLAGKVINCAYAGINEVLRASELPLLGMKYEYTEMGLVEMPEPLRKIGITVMDGPFFSMMPFPAAGAVHSLSHVRYTPHFTWTEHDDQAVVKERLSHIQEKHVSNTPMMIADVKRFLPICSDIVVKQSIWTTKTILQENEHDDGRPILYRPNYGGIQNFSVVMGGKIDNIYDILAVIS